ncbi:phBC6A51 family helix-turn-helix protein [Neobacillus sp. 19]|uniref:phBC6A51 family helix-turn-helix protein n=1 Tax=Neobacillus sp. 19 TaxID=3394458 RepID=UPI003BF6F3A8
MSKRLKALEAKLDARKRKAAYLLVENELLESGERRKQEDIAAEIGVSSKTIWEWKTKDQVFIEYKNAIADDFLSEKRAYVYGQLMKTISGPQPSIKGIDIFMRRFGLLTEKQITVTEDGSSSRSNDDLAKELEELDDLLKD